MVRGRHQYDSLDVGKPDEIGAADGVDGIDKISEVERSDKIHRKVERNP